MRHRSTALNPPQPLRKLRHALNRNTRRGSRRNIAAHYDLGNDFYRAWLDPQHDLFVGALFDGRTQTLEDAQDAKLDRVVERWSSAAASACWRSAAAGAASPSDARAHTAATSPG